MDEGTIWAAFTLRLTKIALEVRCAGGTRLNDWLEPFEASITKAGKEAGVPKLHIRGRGGWGRFAKRFGWHAAGQDERGMPMFEKEL